MHDTACEIITKEVVTNQPENWDCKHLEDFFLFFMKRQIRLKYVGIMQLFK